MVGGTKEKKKKNETRFWNMFNHQVSRFAFFVLSASLGGTQEIFLPFKSSAIDFLPRLAASTERG